MIPSVDELMPLAREAARPSYRGRVDVVSGVLVEAAGLPAALGELCRIDRGARDPIHAEVVGFRGASSLLMPHGDLSGIAPMQEVYALRRPFSIPVTRDYVGRVVDGFGEPLDDGPRIHAKGELRSVRSAAPAALSRVPIDTPLETGVRVIDSMLTVGKGQRMGIFAGSGVGKSTLLGQVTRGTEADAVVVCLVGERGREVRSFLDDVLGPEGRAKSVLVVSTSDRPPIERFTAPFLALTIAEFLRDQGLEVLFVMDSVTRFAAASREVGLAAGEPPTVRGYPPSFFAEVPKLVERLGRTDRGSITGIFTVLLDADDPSDPVGDTLRGLLDGHIVLDRQLAHTGHYPAVDVPGSLSRLMPEIVDPGHMARATKLREWLASHREARDLLDIGAYKPGANPLLDEAIGRMPAIQHFLRQTGGDPTPLAETLAMLDMIVTGEVPS